MKPTIAFLRERKQPPPSRKRAGAGDASALNAAARDALVPRDQYGHPEWPEPQDVVDMPHIQLAASTRQRTQVQRRAENKKYQQRRARAVCRQFMASARAAAERLEKEIVNTRRVLAERQRQKKHFDRFGHRTEAAARNTTDTRKPCTVWIQVLFGAVVVVMLIAILNGTLSVSAVMLDSTTFSGQYLKTITIALGFFLLPGLGLSIPFHLLRAHLRWAYAYLGLLVSLGITFGFLFAVTWAHTYAVDTGNQTLIDLTTIGMGADHDVVEAPQPWLIENANWLSLFFQILADMCFAGAAKSYLSYLTWNYSLFPNKAHQQVPEWLELDREVRELSRTLAELESEKLRAEERLVDLETEADEFVEAVCAYADGLFLQEVDRFEQEAARVRDKEAELREKEAAWRQSRQEFDALLTQTPGINRKGDPS